jgi:hypothetical protein
VNHFNRTDECGHVVNFFSSVFSATGRLCLVAARAKRTLARTGGAGASARASGAPAARAQSAATLLNLANLTTADLVMTTATAAVAMVAVVPMAASVQSQEATRKQVAALEVQGVEASEGTGEEEEQRTQPTRCLEQTWPVPLRDPWATLGVLQGVGVRCRGGIPAAASLSRCAETSSGSSLAPPCRWPWSLPLCSKFIAAAPSTVAAGFALQFGARLFRAQRSSHAWFVVDVRLPSHRAAVTWYVFGCSCFCHSPMSCYLAHYVSIQILPAPCQEASGTHGRADPTRSVWWGRSQCRNVL